MKARETWSPFIQYASGKKKKWPCQDIACMALLFFCLVWLLIRASSLPEYQWRWDLLLEFLLRRGADGNLEAGLLTRGLGVTLRIGLWTILFSLVFGSLLGILAAKKTFPGALPYQAPINLLRNTPPLVLLFCVYFFAGNLLPGNLLDDAIRTLPGQGQDFFALVFAPPGQTDKMLAAILALGCYQGAYVAEIVRAGIESVPNGQWDAAKALGFSRFATLKLVIMPQAMRLMLPPLTGQCISTFKDSALASLISIPDLTFQSLEIMAISGMTFEIWISCALMYLGISAVCALIGHALERKFSISQQ